VEFLRKLFSSGDFMAHGFCYLWQPALIWLHVVSDTLIALAYFSIPLTLIYFVRKRRDVPFNWVFVCFGVFILTCGATHAMEVWTLWHATYWLSGAVKGVTALASVPTAILLVGLIPKALAIPSPEALRIEIAERKRTQEDLRKAKDELERRVEERTSELRKINADLLAEIVQRNLAEEELRRSEDRMRSLVETVKDYAIFGLDPSGRVVSWNVGAEHIKGYDAKEIMGQHFSRFYPPESLLIDLPEMQLRVAASEGRFEEDGWRVRKDGSRFWANMVITALRDRDGDLLGFSKITRDLTERKRAEEALRESEEQLRLAQKASGSGVWDWNPRTGIVSWSEEHSRIFGVEPGQQDRPWKSFLQLVHAEDRARLESEANSALKPSGELEVEYRIGRADDQVRWVVSKGQTHCGDGDEPIRMIGLTQDITERKQLEQALLKTQTELAHLSRVMTMGELTSSIAHEVNQPLAAVVTNGDACLRWIAAEPPNLNKVRESVASIIQQAARAGEVITRIRALAKKATPQKTALRIDELIFEVIGLVGGELAKHHVFLETELESGLPVVFGDRVQLQQVILNLIANGIEAMSTVTGRPRDLSIATKTTEGGQILISVRDCGSGLTPELIDHVFEAFFTTKQAGIGLGLSISRTIVETHGGRLWATPNPAHGATFQFTLPLAAGAAA
jgi:PAS domain S-box-containing protein